MTNPATTYQPLGNFIRKVDNRNHDLKVKLPMGINIEKQFMPSVANVIGTDMSSYKLVGKNQFACNLMHVGRDGKIPISINLNDVDILVSPAYHVFEISDQNTLHPEFLMMWFHRDEFDREASFYTDSDVRCGLDFNTLLEMRIPVPPIAEQRAIVAEYAAVQHRMEVNKRLIAKLEETAQTLYKKMFVDGVDKENLPDGWRMGTLGEIADFCYGKLPNKDFDGTIPVFSGYGVVGYTNDEMFNKQHIIVIARGDSGSGKIVLSPEKFFLTNLAIAIILNDEFFKFYLYYHLLSLDTSVLRSGSAQAQVTVSSLFPFEIIIPSTEAYTTFYNDVKILHERELLATIEIEKLTELQSLLLARMFFNK